MRFSVEKKFLFLANPKTGSTSLRNILDEYSQHKELELLGKYHDHWTARQYKSVFLDLGYDWDSFYKFINIRNPWDKYVSNFHYCKPDENFHPFYNEKYDKNTAGSAEFNGWVKFHLQTLKTPPQGCYRVDKFAGDADGNIIVDDIFPIEDFASTNLPNLIRRLGLNDDIKLPFLNTTKKRQNYQSYYDEESKALVAEFCYLDIEYGKYNF